MNEPIRESEVIERWGVPKDELTAFRKASLVEGKDYERIPMGKRPLSTCPVSFTEEGLSIVFQRFGLVQAGKVHEPAPKPTDVLVHAEVLRCNFPNVRILEIVLPDGKRAICNVFNSRLFKPKLLIAVKYRSGRYYCEHRPTSILRINSLINRNTK